MVKHIFSTVKTFIILTLTLSGCAGTKTVKDTLKLPQQIEIENRYNILSNNYVIEINASNYPDMVAYSKFVPVTLYIYHEDCHSCTETGPKLTHNAKESIGTPGQFLLAKMNFSTNRTFAVDTLHATMTPCLIKLNEGQAEPYNCSGKNF